MPLSPNTLEEKPYNMCLDCEHIGKKCDGPNFLAMTIERWCEWCHLRKDILGWTNSYVAELAEVSKISVDRVMSGAVKDLRISTMQAITRALVNGSWGKYPCAMSDNTEIMDRANHAEEECRRLMDARAEDRQKIDFLMQQIKFKEDQMQNKDRQLQERYDFLNRKDRVIRLLSVFLFASVLTILIALCIDNMNPNVGFFWLQ